MNRINSIGMEVMEFKKELLKEYPKIIIDALLLSIDQKVKSEVIDLNTLYLIKDSATTLSDIEEYILSKEQYLKTKEELLKEFDDIKDRLDKEILNRDLNLNLISESVVDKNAINVTKSYLIDSDFVLKYFGVEEKDLLNLMKRNNFIEKFAIFRLPKILGDFINQYNMDTNLFKIDSSLLVYFDISKNAYAIDLTFEINIEILEKEDLLVKIASEISKIVNSSNEFYNKKMEY